MKSSNIFFLPSSTDPPSSTSFEANTALVGGAVFFDDSIGVFNNPSIAGMEIVSFKDNVGKFFGDRVSRFTDLEFSLRTVNIPDGVDFDYSSIDDDSDSGNDQHQSSINKVNVISNLRSGALLSFSVEFFDADGKPLRIVTDIMSYSNRVLEKFLKVNIMAKFFEDE